MNVKFAGLDIGGKNFTVIAGPCAVENEDQMLQASNAVKAAGAHVLRAGLYKLRTRPDAFQGLGRDGFPIVKLAKQKCGLPFLTEITSASQVEALADIADFIMVGTRNMYNYDLLKELGRARVPVVLKRGMSAKVEEWINAAEYIARGGNDKIILCERGIRTFETATRNTLDLAGALWVKQRSALPVIVDPSHGTGIPALIPGMAAATLAAGLDGVMVEVHPMPSAALSDGSQALTTEQFADMMEKLKRLGEVCNRPVHAPGGHL
ncbi:MAG: 3-deoxy-7-phosphoheptulonate synthase [Bacteriovoracaceae bacterium]|nr:3-deoxy-7-phosphoheptulonate synthase [Bacteriovoracaceae bacterium]